MKKFLAVCLSAALAASMLVGCGGNNEKVTAKVIDIDLTNEEYAFGVDKEQPELLDEVNDFIASIKEDGTLDEICNKYFSDGEQRISSLLQQMQHLSLSSIQRVKIIMESIWRSHPFLQRSLEKNL